MKYRDSVGVAQSTQLVLMPSLRGADDPTLAQALMFGGSHKYACARNHPSWKSHLCICPARAYWQPALSGSRACRTACIDLPAADRASVKDGTPTWSRPADHAPALAGEPGLGRCGLCLFCGFVPPLHERMSMAVTFP